MRKGLWLVVIGLMALSLVMAACGPAATPTTPTTRTTPTTPAAPTAPVETPVQKEAIGQPETKTVTLTKLDGAKVETTQERPKYGGTHTYSVTRDAGEFEPAITSSPGLYHPLGYSVLLDADPTRGPGGTNETTWNRGFVMGFIGFLTGSLSESYEIPDDTTIIFRLRQGVRFALNPNSEASRLVGGREMTADDVVYSFERLWKAPNAYYLRTHPNEKMQGIRALDKWTVEYKILPNQHGIHLVQAAGRLPIMAQEVVKKYGDLSNWRNLVGTGAFMLTDFVAGSSRTYIRNPNYFRMDPYFPENRLPYIDSVKVLVIPDRSTMLAALRTGKLDVSSGPLEWDEAKSFARTQPQVVQRKSLRLSAPIALTGHLDRPGIWGPLNDPNALKVRRALHMAFNKQAIVDDYYGGNAVLFSDPWPPTEDYEGIFRPLETFSPEVQELYRYNPEKAKKLLAEAGYPNGFKAKVLMTSDQVDLYSILKADYEKVGVILEFDVKESGAYSALRMERTYAELTNGWGNVSSFPWKGHQLRPEAWGTASSFDHPIVRKAFDELMVVFGRDTARMKELYAKMAEPILETAPKVWWPKPYEFYAWWPWLKRYDGMRDMGVYNPEEGYNEWVWIDQELKKKMGY